MPTAQELIFKITAQGTSELDKVALATKTIGEGTALAGAQLKTFDSTLKSLVATGKTYWEALDEMSRSNGVLSSSVRSTAASLLDQMKAAEGDEAAIRRLSGAHAQLTGNVLQARAAVQALNGNLGTMAAGRWLASIPALKTALSGIFSVVGPLAFIGVVDQAVGGIQRLAEKWDPVAQAEKRAKDALEDYGKSVDAVNRKLRENENREFRLKYGAAAADAHEAEQLSGDAASKTRQAGILSAQLAVIKKELADAQARPVFHAPGADASAVNMMRERDINQAKADIDALTARISELQNDAAVLNSDSRLKTIESATSQLKKDGKGDNTAAELKKRRAEELLRLQQELADAQAKELAPIDAINAKRDASIAKLRAENLLTKEILDTLNKIAVADTAKYTTDLIKKTTTEVHKQAAKDIEAMDSDESRSDRYGSKKFQEDLKKEIAKEEKDLNALLKVISSGDQSDADGVRRGLQVAIAGNATAARGGRISGGTAAGNDLQARIDAANQIYAIETKHLDLITDEGQREEKLADAKKKYADELYQAEAQYEEQLDALREKDLQKYQNLAGKIFDALINRQRGAAFEFKQMLRGEAVNTGRQIFENLAAKTLQEVGHATAGAIPGQSSAGGVLGGILKGTVFSSANKGVPAVADPAATARDTAITATATHTQTASDWLKQIYGLISGNTPTDPSGANPSSDAANAALPGGAPLAAATAAAVASLPAALGASASGNGTSAVSAISALVKSTGLGSFGSGLSSVLSGGALGNLLYGGTAYGGSLSNQIGAGVGIAGALAAGGLGIASGISQGGVRGDLTAAGSAAGLVGMAVKNIAPLLGAVSPLMNAIPIVGTALAAVLPLVGSLFGTGPTQRQNQINTELAKNAYLAPTAMNVTQGMNGTYEDFDARGNLRTSTMRAVPTVAEPYITSTRLTPGGPLTYYNSPGGVLAPYTGAATGTGVAPVSNAPQPVIIQAMDSQSFTEFAHKNSNAFGEALATHLQSGNGQRTADTIRFHSGS